MVKLLRKSIAILLIAIVINLLYWSMLSCAYQVPRKESGRIDERQIKRDIDIELTDKIRVDVEKVRILFECRVRDVFCI